MSREGLRGGTFEANRHFWEKGFYSGGNASSSDFFEGGNAYEGNWYAYLGDRGSGFNNAHGYLYQYIYPSPESDATEIEVTYYINVTSDEGTATPYDFMTNSLRLFDIEGEFLEDVTLFVHDNRTQDALGTYRKKRVKYTITNSQAVHYMIIFRVKTDSTLRTTFRIDNVSAQVIRPDQTFTVTSSAGSGGTISPDGSKVVAANERLTYDAIPDSGYEVAHWLMNGVILADEGNSFETGRITQNTSIEVRFKPLEHALQVSSTHGSVERSPDLTHYPHGSWVTLKPRADAGYTFAEWTGNATGAGNPLVVKVVSDMSINATFVVSPSPVEVGYSIGGENAVQRVSLGIPALATVYQTLVKISRDFGRTWFNYDARMGQTVPATVILPTFPPGELAMCRLEVRVPIADRHFMQFPIKGVDDPYSVPISAIFDLDHDEPGHIRTYRNQLATEEFSVDSPQDSSLKGFKMDEDGTAFDLGYAYSSKSVLYYDDHTGYDYPATRQTEVVAAASGVIDWPSTKTQADWKGLCILHDNGFRTFYLHLTSWREEIQNAEDTPFRVERGDPIGFAGNTGVPNATKDKYIHLHFTVKNPLGNRVDPYGEFSRTGVEIAPVLWILP